MTIFLPKGFRFAGVHCGLKSDPAQSDLSLFVSDVPATAAGVFTPNLVCGAPVRVDRDRLPGEGFRAVVGNSRCANACTGDQGLRDAGEMAALASQAVGGDADKGLVLSTGVIGTMLPMDKIRTGIAAAAAKLAATEDALLDAARGIMTTDTVEKYVTKRLVLSGDRIVTLAGVCKGAAMIAPNLATMLAVVMTDAALDPASARNMLRDAAEESFNCISVEGHTSTSDALLLLANGASGVAIDEDDRSAFAGILRELCIELAVKIPEDGEGTTHLITIDVEGCRDRSAAKAIARKIAEDVLVKTAICGADPNWGRIVSASGTAGVPYDPNKVVLRLNGVELFRDGAPQPFNRKVVADSIRDRRDTHIAIRFGEGDAGIRFWTTDLTAEYVRLNSDYTT